MIKQLYLILSRFSQVAPINNPDCPVDTDGAECNTNLPQVNADSATLRTALQFIFGIIAVVAVIYIVIAGFTFVTSQGDPQKVAKARQTILFAVIGLVVAVSAQIIITFVLKSL